MRLLVENSRLQTAAANLLLEIRALKETRVEAAPPTSRRPEPFRDNPDQNAQREQALTTEASQLT